jgi:hypothetical protein
MNRYTTLDIDGYEEVIRCDNRKAYPPTPLPQPGADLADEQGHRRREEGLSGLVRIYSSAIMNGRNFTSQKPREVIDIEHDRSKYIATLIGCERIENGCSASVALRSRPS